MVPPRADSNACTLAWEAHVRLDQLRYGDIELEAPARAPPGNLRNTVGGELARAGRTELPPHQWAHPQRAAARLFGRQPRNVLVQELSHGTERIVVERRHLTRVDGAVGQHGVPAFPYCRCPHRHRVEPRRAAVLEQ